MVRCRPRTHPPRLPTCPPLCSTSQVSPTRWDVALPYCGSIPQRLGSACTHTRIRKPDRILSSMSFTCSPSTEGSTIQTPGAITGRYSSRQMIVRRNAGRTRSDCPQIRMAQRTKLAPAPTGPTDTRSFMRWPKTRALRSMSAGCRPWPPPRRSPCGSTVTSSTNTYSRTTPGTRSHIRSRRGPKIARSASSC